MSVCLSVCVCGCVCGCVCVCVCVYVVKMLAEGGASDYSSLVSALEGKGLMPKDGWAKGKDKVCVVVGCTYILALLVTHLLYYGVILDTSLTLCLVSYMVPKYVIFHTTYTSSHMFCAYGCNCYCYCYCYYCLYLCLCLCLCCAPSPSNHSW